MNLERVAPDLLGFDFDGVIADTAETFIRLACEKYGLCGIRKEDITNFAVEQCLNIDREMVEEIFTMVLIDSVGTGLKPMPGAVEVLGELADQAEITVITARPCASPVHEWLGSFFPRSTLPRFRVVAMGAHDDKSQHIHEQGLRYFIDDRAETCVQLSQSGIQPIVFSQPWNENRHQLPVVNSWQEIRALIGDA
jgi:5'(3')-deoxyribonucleotidase